MVLTVIPQRLREFDALRGFSMLSVVYVHVIGLGLGANALTDKIVISYFMPLFFFISGFFAFKPLNDWDRGLFCQQISQKLKSLVFCTIAFYTFRYYTLGADPFGWIEKGFQGYWFTITLFDMFVLYFFAIVLSKVIKRNIVLPIMVVLAIGGNFLIPTGLFNDSQFGTIIGVVNLCFFLQWFVLGLIAKRFNVKFNVFLSNSKVKAALILLYLIGMCIKEAEYLNGQCAKIFGSVIIPYLAVLLLVSLFYSFRDYYNKPGIIAGFLCMTGRKSLDIYMIHYFFLPTLPALGEWISPNSMITFQLIIGISLSVIITSICLIISNCLRSSSILAEWLFGARKKRQIE